MSPSSPHALACSTELPLPLCRAGHSTPWSVPLSDPSRLYTRDLQLASRRSPFVVRGPALPAPAWPVGNMVGELASLDVLGPESGGSTHVAVFLDTLSCCTWLTPMASLACSEFVSAVQHYQQYVVAPKHVSSRAW